MRRQSNYGEHAAIALLERWNHSSDSLLVQGPQTIDHGPGSSGCGRELRGLLRSSEPRSRPPHTASCRRQHPWDSLFQDLPPSCAHHGIEDGVDIHVLRPGAYRRLRALSRRQRVEEADLDLRARLTTLSQPWPVLGRPSRN